MLNFDTVGLVCYRQTEMAQLGCATVGLQKLIMHKSHTGLDSGVAYRNRRHSLKQENYTYMKLCYLMTV